MTRAMRHSNFKDRLCYIDGDGRMLHGTPPDVWFLRTDRDDFGTSMPFKSPGGVHFISCAAWTQTERPNIWPLRGERTFRQVKHRMPRPSALLTSNRRNPIFSPGRIGISSGTVDVANVAV